jgi:hypothetical protein
MLTQWIRIAFPCRPQSGNAQGRRAWRSLCSLRGRSAESQRPPAILFEGMLDSIRAPRGLRERVLLLKAIQFENGRFETLAMRQHIVRTVNGQVDLLIAIRHPRSATTYKRAIRHARTLLR